MKLFIRWAVMAVAVWVSTLIVPGIKVHGGAWSYLWVALIFGLVNTFIGSLLKVLTLPAVILSLGFFILVINAAMLELTARWSSALDISSFWAALFASLIISIVSSIMNSTLEKAGGADKN